MADAGAVVALRNIGLRAWRRLQAVHKPVVRMARRRARANEHREVWREVSRIERELARLASAGRPILAGPWLAEVGYEVLYWLPFLRWFQDAYRVPRGQIVAVTRGGAGAWYGDVAGAAVEIFDLMPPRDLSARNDVRRAEVEGGGRKQTTVGGLDRDLLERAAAAAGLSDPGVLHPSLMFAMFRHVWHGLLPFDHLWTRARFPLLTVPAAAPVGLPVEFTAVKLYSGAALPSGAGIEAGLRELVRRAARTRAVVVLDSGVQIDEHEDFRFDDLPNVVAASRWMTPATNLAVQTAVIARARLFLGTCGGLAWLAPFLGTPTVAAYADDRQLAPHLYVARQAMRRAGAAEFATVDLRAGVRLDG